MNKTPGHHSMCKCLECSALSRRHRPGYGHHLADCICTVCRIDRDILAQCKETPLSNPNTLTIRHAQVHQPWVLPLAPVHDGRVPHQLAAHAVLHAAKSTGKLAGVFEALDHSGLPINDEQRETIKAMAADLMTIALRFANLYQFNIAEVLVERVTEKNGISYRPWS